MSRWRDRSDRRRETLLAGLAIIGRLSNEDPVRGCPSGPELTAEFIMRPYICVQSDLIAGTHDLASEGESIYAWRQRRGAISV